MTFKLINIKPCDNTFFGDGTQFNFDINKNIKSKNTPYPSVFFGSIFTAILTHNDNFRKEFFKKGNYDHESILQIGQVYLFNEKEKKLYIKAPLDLFINSKNEVGFGKFEKNITKTSLKYEYILRSPKNKDYTRVKNMYIDIKNIYDAYLKKNRLRINLKRENQIFLKNKKIGIGIDKKSKVVEDGKLYKIEQTEFTSSDWSYVVEYKIDKEYLSQKYSKVKDLNLGYLKLGGENKASIFKTITDNRIEKKISEFKKMEKFKNNIYKIIFTSETYFIEGIEQSFNENGIEILGISNEKPIYIGGYDMKGKGTVRKMYKGYEAGTVILVKVNENDSDSIYKLLKNNSVKGFNNYAILKEEI